MRARRVCTRRGGGQTRRSRRCRHHPKVSVMHGLQVLVTSLQASLSSTMVAPQFVFTRGIMSSRGTRVLEVVVLPHTTTLSLSSYDLGYLSTQVFLYRHLPYHPYRAILYPTVVVEAGSHSRYGSPGMHAWAWAVPRPVRCTHAVPPLRT